MKAKLLHTSRMNTKIRTVELQIRQRGMAAFAKRFFYSLVMWPHSLKLSKLRVVDATPVQMTAIVAA